MKKLILILGLLLPIGIFLFLGLFGKNEFSIPVYYKNGVDNIPPSCARSYKSPYLVSDSLLKTLGWKGDAVLLMADTSHAGQPGLERLKKEVGTDVQVIFPAIISENYSEIYTCDLFLEKPWTVVLVDNQRRIRGYYAPETREEVDRLIVELKILLKQY